MTLFDCVLSLRKPSNDMLSPPSHTILHPEITCLFGPFPSSEPPLNGGPINAHFDHLQQRGLKLVLQTLLIGLDVSLLFHPPVLSQRVDDSQ